MNELVNKLIELKTGLRQKDPTFCGGAPAWLIEAVLRNLDIVTAQLQTDDQVTNQRINGLAIGAIRYVADQAPVDCDVLLNRLNELATMAGSQ